MWKHSDERIFNILRSSAETAECVRSSRHACAITYKNKVLAIGRNSLKTHPIMLKFGRNPSSLFLHAEIDAMVKTINQHGVDILSDCELYVLRITKSGKIAESCPCEGCQKAIDFFNIKKVYHT